MLDLETAFRILSVTVYAIVLFLALIVVPSGIGRVLRRKRKEQTWKPIPDEHASNPGAESYRGER